MAGNGIIGALLVSAGMDTADLEDGVKRVGRNVDKANKRLGDIGKGVATAAGHLRNLATIAAGATIGLVAAVIPAINEYENLSAALVTATGSAVEAENAFAELQDFAAKTPYELGEVTAAFIKLKNMGLDPSMEAITSYGNTASAMGKGLNDMIEAVADAATGEFERLKEFGIRSSSEGDRVKFTFQGVTTEVGKNSEEIQRYLLGLGNVQFAGGMELQAQTLAGTFSSLSDTFKGFAAAIGEGGVSDALRIVMNEMMGSTDGARQLGTEIGARLSVVILQLWDGLNNIIKAGQDLKKWFDSIDPAVKGATATFVGLTAGIAGLAAGLQFMAATAIPAATAAVIALSAKLAAMIPLVVATAPIWAPIAAGVALVTGAVYAFIKYRPQIEAMWKAFKEFAARSIEAIRGLPAMFRQFARDVMQGFADGIRAAIEAPIRAIRWVADQVKNAFKRDVEIRSPSRVFMQYGEFISQGLAIGIRNRSDEAVRAMQSLADQLKGIWRDLLTEEEREWMDYMERRNAFNQGVQRRLLTPEEAAELQRRDEARRDQEAGRKFREGMQEFEVKRPLNDVVRAPTLVIPDEALKRLQDGMAQAANDNDEFYNGVRQTFREGFRAALDGDLGDFVREWFKDRIASAMENALNTLADFAADWFANAMKSAGSSSPGQPGAGGWMQTIGNIFKSFMGGGARANGGPVMAGRPYLVGERGPEPFIPSTSGYIQRNGDLHGAGRGSVINIYADRSVVANDIRQMIGQAMVATGRGAHDATINTLTNRAGRRFG